MTPQKLLKHLKTVGDSTHSIIFVYLQKLNMFSWGHARQDPGVNFKKKPDSDEEEKEEEEMEEEEKEVAAPLDNWPQLRRAPIIIWWFIKIQHKC